MPSSDSTIAVSPAASSESRLPNIWFRPNANCKQQQTEEPGFIGPLLPNPMPTAMGMETDAECAWTYYPQLADLSLCNCWMAMLDLLKLSVSPIVDGQHPQNGNVQNLSS
ncbi:unnamed protein product [Dibothriocephalus latus]|uniref:Uncharacterized protein n=1 Tax=Dibothriocephalus latus TaxID=60516 RepID=A0A3P7QNE0_DIBLA|nr:unnamed protein product [Dibothriocephalus latus]